ncbi:unnamed protein product [Spirodela intermedia]|uniref:Retrotransposon gag domain-containing protein n=1 Tax=Spirodela intermedia TaxID=51605 RepID=A0A7I8KBB3_SPIIN|nr:unnamed protein product [Spirodela intermedia]
MVCDLVNLPQVTPEIIKMKLFPHTLRDKASHWLSTLDRELTSWKDIEHAFLRKFYPLGKTQNMRKHIWSFSQRLGETLHETWEIFKDLLRKCPHHAIPKWQLNRIFYDGLLEQHRNMVDSICGGAFMEKTPNEIYSLYENLSKNSRDQASFELYDKNKKRGIYELYHDDDSKLRNEVNQINQRLEKLDLLIDNIRKPLNPQFNSNSTCPMYGENDYSKLQCYNLDQSFHHKQEQVQVARGFNKNREPFSNSYNPNWKNNFSWRDPNNIQNLKKNQPSQIQLDAMEMMQQMMNALRSGKILPDPYPQTLEEKENVDNPKQNQIGVEEDFIDSTKEILKERTTIPFTKALEPRQRKKKEHNEEIKKILQDVQISLPLLTTIEHIPEYARVLKEMCTPKRAPRVEKLSMHVSTLLLNQLPYKLRDTGAPLISCDIGRSIFQNALLDTGASINLLPASICDKFNISDLKPSTVTLQFADRSIKHPKGILENVIEDYLNLKLKPLPSSLKYMFLEENNSFPVIIAADLSDEQEEELLDVLRKNKKAMGWKMDDLRGIDMSVCMHNIYLEEGARTSREPQRRLNPNMMEIVKKEINLLFMQHGQP